MRTSGGWQRWRLGGWRRQGPEAQALAQTSRQVPVRQAAVRPARLSRTLILVWGLVGAPGLAWAQMPSPAVPNALAQRLQACTVCHGATDQVRADAYFPRLAGKPAGYLLAQLQNFREGRRHYAPMERLLAGLPEAYLAEIAAYFAAQPVVHGTPAGPAPAAAQAARGERIARQGLPDQRLPACAACHGTALTGVQPAVPGLLGLPRNYLAAQLGAWRNGQRQARAPDCMGHIAGQLSAEDLAATVSWLASQPVPADARPAERPPGPWPLACGSLPAGPGAAR